MTIRSESAVLEVYMLARRTISTIVLSCITIVSIFIEPLFIAVVTLFTLAAMLEFFALIEKKGIAVYKYFGTLIGLMLNQVLLLQIALKFQILVNLNQS